MVVVEREASSIWRRVCWWISLSGMLVIVEWGGVVGGGE